MVLNRCAHIRWKHCGAPSTKKSKTTSGLLTSGLLTRVSPALIARRSARAPYAILISMQQIAELVLL